MTMKLDVGCGGKKREGFIGCDQYKMDGVDHVFNIGKDKWPFDDDSVEEVYSSHFIEHLNATERIHFYNELYRVMKVGTAATVIVPHWCSNRAYGDPTHQWPPVSEMSFYYLSKEWRATQAPHTDKKWNKKGFACDFEASWGYGMHQALAVRNQEYQQFAMQWAKEAILDIHINLKKK